MQDELLALRARQILRFVRSTASAAARSAVKSEDIIIARRVVRGRGTKLHMLTEGEEAWPPGWEHKRSVQSALGHFRKHARTVLVQVGREGEEEEAKQEAEKEEVKETDIEVIEIVENDMVVSAVQPSDDDSDDRDNEDHAAAPQRPTITHRAELSRAIRKLEILLRKIQRARAPSDRLKRKFGAQLSLTKALVARRHERRRRMRLVRRAQYSGGVAMTVGLATYCWWVRPGWGTLRPFEKWP